MNVALNSIRKFRISYKTSDVMYTCGNVNKPDLSWFRGVMERGRRKKSERERERSST